MAAGKVSKFVVGVSSSKLNLEEAKQLDQHGGGNVTLYSAIENDFAFMHCNFHFDLPEFAKEISNLSKATKYAKRGVMGIFQAI